MIHLYAVVGGLRELPAQRGIDGESLQRLRVDGFELVFGEVVGPVTSPSEEAVLRHAQIVEGLMQRSAAVLPARLGGGFTDAEHLADTVRARAEGLRDALRRVEGCVELGLRVLQPPAAAERTGQTGGDYLRARLDQKQDLEQRALELHEPLSRLARASMHSLGSPLDTVLEGAYLVPVEGVERFRDELDRLELAADGLVFVCTGPWPPYSFAVGEAT